MQKHKKGSGQAKHSQHDSIPGDLVQARRAGRSNAGRGLASELQGMQAQLADLDAMWSVVNAPKLEHTAGSKVCYEHILVLSLPGQL